MTAAATTAAGPVAAAVAAAFVPPPTGSPSKHPEGACGAAKAQIREPLHPGAMASVRARGASAHYTASGTGASLNPFLQSPSPRSVKMTFRGSYFIFPQEL